MPKPCTGYHTVTPRINILPTGFDQSRKSSLTAVFQILDCDVELYAFLIGVIFPTLRRASPDNPVKPELGGVACDGGNSVLVARRAVVERIDDLCATGQLTDNLFVLAVIEWTGDQFEVAGNQEN